MAIYRTIQLSFWTDNKIVDNFTPEDKYFYLYLLTNPHTNLIGCYEVSISTIANQLGYNKESVERLLERFENFHKVIKYSKQTKELLLLNWSKYNWQGGNQEKCLLKEVSIVKNSEFKRFLIDVFEIKFGQNKGHTSPIQATVTVTVNNIYNFNTNSNTKNLEYLFNNTEDYKNLKDNFKQAMFDWMEYKDERTPKKNNHYSEKALKTWITQTVNKAKEVGVSKVIEQIHNAIANQWQGTNLNLIKGEPRDGK